MTPEQARVALPRLVERVNHYGFGVSYCALEPPKTGVFDGLVITLDVGQPIVERCFLLLHLFGHSVQWTSGNAAALQRMLRRGADVEAYLANLRSYEHDAARYGWRLLIEVGLEQHREWFANRAETDWQYVARFHREGKIPPLFECRRQATEPIAALPIPPLRPRKVAERFAF